MQKLETRWLVVHTVQRTVVVVHRWDDTYSCTCGLRSPCIHIKKVQAHVGGHKIKVIVRRKMRRGPRFAPIPHQITMPEWFPEDFIPTRKFR